MHAQSDAPKHLYENIYDTDHVIQLLYVKTVTGWHCEEYHKRNDTIEILITCKFFDCGIGSEKWSGTYLTDLTDSSDPV